MPGLQVIKPFGRFPSLMCPACEVPMVLKDMRPIIFAKDLYATKYHCDRCDTDITREFKRGHD
jgi:hypothetical protein